MEEEGTAEVLQLALIETSEGLTLKPAEEEGSNGVKTEIGIISGCLVNSKMNFLEISVVNLSSCNLISIPREFSVLENLRVLNLSHNSLVEVPDCLVKDLRFVEYLDLSHNGLKEFEREPACHVRLKVLLLNNNNLFNIPEWILYVRCFNLEEFDFGYNTISCLYASQFNVKSNYRLKKLGLQSCCIYDRDLEYINGIKTLKHLDLSNHKWTKVNTNQFEAEKLFKRPAFSETLTVLKLNYLTVSILPDSIACMVNLRELYVVGSCLSYLPDALTSFRNLEILDVSENSICVLPVDLYKLRNLKKLVVFSNILTNLPDLSKMEQLYYIDLYRNLLPDFPFNIAQFTHLDLEENCIATTELVQYEDYIEKRRNLRSEAGLVYRNNVAINLDEPEQDIYRSIPYSHYDSSDDDLESHHCQKLTEEYVEEFWDVQKDSNYIRVCTSSDDEWTGEAPPPVGMVWKEPNSWNTIEQHVSPDDIFSNAD